MSNSVNADRVVICAVYSLPTSLRNGYDAEVPDCLRQMLTVLTIANMEPHIARNTRLAVDRMVEESKQNRYTDVFKWFTFMVCSNNTFDESYWLNSSRPQTLLVKPPSAKAFGCWRLARYLGNRTKAILVLT
jgi:hypothetical protein